MVQEDATISEQDKVQLEQDCEAFEHEHQRDYKDLHKRKEQSNGYLSTSMINWPSLMMTPTFDTRQLSDISNNNTPCIQ